MAIPEDGRRRQGSIWHAVPVEAARSIPPAVVDVPRRTRRLRSDQISIGPNFGRRVYELRTAFGLTREEFLGDGREENLRKIEKGDRDRISLALAQEIAGRAGISLADLFNSGLSVAEILDRNPKPNPAKPQDKENKPERIAECDRERSEADIAYQRRLREREDLKKEGIEIIGDRVEVVLFSKDGEDWSYTKNGMVKVSSMRGTRFLSLGDAGDEAISALQKKIAEKKRKH